MVATPGALRALEEANQNPFEFLERHQAGDWGELCEEDKDENEFSVRNGFRILSAYRTRNNVKIWVITEADRSATTLLSSPRILARQAILKSYPKTKWLKKEKRNKVCPQSTQNGQRRLVPLIPIEVDGFHAFADAYALDEQWVIFLSIAGHKDAVKAIRATLLTNHWINVGNHEICLLPRTKYGTSVKTLPSGNRPYSHIRQK